MSVPTRRRPPTVPARLITTMKGLDSLSSTGYA